VYSSPNLLVPRSWKSRAIPLPTHWTTGPVTSSLYLLLLTKYYSGDQIKKNEIQGHVARMGRGEHTGFDGKHVRKRPLERLCRRWEDDIVGF